MLGGLGLQLAGRANVGQQGEVDEERPIALELAMDLAQRLQEWLTLDVADGAANFGDDHLSVGLASDPLDALLDLVGDVRHNLDRAAEEVAAPFAGDHGRIDLAGRDVGQARVRFSSMKRS